MSIEDSDFKFATGLVILAAVFAVALVVFTLIYQPH